MAGSYSKPLQPAGRGAKSVRQNWRVQANFRGKQLALIDLEHTDGLYGSGDKAFRGFLRPGGGVPPSTHPLVASPGGGGVPRDPPTFPRKWAKIAKMLKWYLFQKFGRQKVYPTLSWPPMAGVSQIHPPSPPRGSKTKKNTWQRCNSTTQWQQTIFSLNTQNAG